VTLRRKLLTLLTALATTALLLVAAGFWATSSQQAAHEELENHLLRSLLLQRIDSTGRVLLRGQFAAVVADTPGARERFDTLERGIREDLAKWSEMPSTEAQTKNRRAVERTFDQAIAEIHATFTVLDRGDQDQAFERLIAYDRDQPFAAFREATAAKNEANALERAAIRLKVERTRETVQIGLAIAAIAVLSLVFLFVAYLGGEIFRPLRDLQGALDAAARGDHRGRLDEGRDDELGEVSRSFNRLMDALDAELASPTGSSETQSRSARAELQRRVAALRASLQEGRGDDSSAELDERLDRITETLERMTSFAAPTDLSFRPVDLAALLHDVAGSFSATFARRAVGIEVSVDPQVLELIADPRKLRTALLEVVRTSIDALPDRGGRVGLRAVPDPDDEGWVLIEIADDGPHGDPRRYERALAAHDDDSGEPESSLAMAFDVFVAHGGRVEVDANPGHGTRTLLRLPVK
jgi:two-component system, OmpR family, sensor kinase